MSKINKNCAMIIRYWRQEWQHNIFVKSCCNVDTFPSDNSANIGPKVNHYNAKVKSTQVEVKWEKCRVIGGRPDLRDARLYVCSAVGEGCFLKWCVIDDAKPENPCHTETQTKASTQSYGRCRHSPFCISIHSLCKERKRENHESNSFHFKVSNFINRSYCIVS